MSALPSQMSAFANYLVGTRQARLRGPRDIMNELTIQNYYFPDFARGQKSGVAIKGGTELKDVVKIDAFSNFRAYLGGEVRTPTRGPTDREYMVPWRTFENNRPVTEPEKVTNKEDRFSQFKDLEYSLMQDLTTDHCNGVEAQLWQRPNFALMETRTQITNGKILSLPAVICENGISAPGWGTTSTIQQIRPDNTIPWRNVVSPYDHINPEDPLDGLFHAMRRAMNATLYKPFMGKDKYMQAMGTTSVVAMNGCWYTNLDGLNMVQSLLAASNDQTRFGPQDPGYPHPTLNKVPIKHAAGLDDALLGQTGAITGDPANPGTYTGSPWVEGQPRFLFVQYDAFKLWFHPNYLLKEVGPKDGGALQWDVDTMYMVTWANTFTRSRRRLALVRPLTPTG